jgi:hypothetical protein
MMASELQQTMQLLKNLDLDWVDKLCEVDTIEAELVNQHADDEEVATTARATFQACQFYLILTERVIALCDMTLGELNPLVVAD